MTLGTIRKPRNTWRGTGGVEQHRSGQDLGFRVLSSKIILKDHLGNKTLEMKNIGDQRAEINLHDFLGV